GGEGAGKLCSMGPRLRGDDGWSGPATLVAVAQAVLDRDSARSAARRGGGMYLATVILLLAVLPVASVVWEAIRQPGADLFALIGRWFVFWPVGARLMLAAVLQIVRPAFTAEIFNVTDPKTF